MEDVFDTVVARVAGIAAGHPLAGAISGRVNNLELPERSHDAALKPEPSGGADRLFGWANRLTRVLVDPISREP